MADTILTEELINRLNPFVSSPHIDGPTVREREGTLLTLFGDHPRINYNVRNEYKIGDGSVTVYRNVLQKPELGVGHELLFREPISIAKVGSDEVRASLQNLTSAEAKRIIRALEVNPSLMQSLTNVPLVTYYKGRWGDFYHMAEDPKGNLRNWLGELWDAQKKVNVDELHPVLFPHIKERRKKVQRELFDALNKRIHGSNALMTAGMGLAGAIAGDEDSKIKTSILGALGAGLGTYGSTFAQRLAPSNRLQNKLYRILVRRPWLRMGAGALGGLAGILAGKGTSSSPEGGVMDELADKVEDLTGADVKGSDMLKYILLGGGGLAALGGLGYAATRKKKKKSEEERDA